jgi:hypothetical protein
VQKIIPSTDGQTMKQVEYAQVFTFLQGLYRKLSNNFLGTGHRYY